jgi:hypothetical protein
MLSKGDDSRSVWAADVRRPQSFASVRPGTGLSSKRQREGAAISDPLRLEAGIQMIAAGLMMAAACPD